MFTANLTVRLVLDQKYMLIVDPSENVDAPVLLLNLCLDHVFQFDGILVLPLVIEQGADEPASTAAKFFLCSIPAPFPWPAWAINQQIIASCESSLVT